MQNTKSFTPPEDWVYVDVERHYFNDVTNKSNPIVFTISFKVYEYKKVKYSPTLKCNKEYTFRQTPYVNDKELFEIAVKTQLKRLGIECSKVYIGAPYFIQLENEETAICYDIKHV